MTQSSDNAPMTARAADFLARRLYEAGCRFAFGMPGGEVLTLIDALEKAGIRFVLAKHENAAGFMAEGTHHRTGAPGILVATIGPGAMNAVNVVANADQDRVPLIVLTGCMDSDEALTYTHQVMDHQAIFRPLTRASFAMTAAGADIIADKAVTIATSQRPGPVHIDVPIAVAVQEVTIERPTRRIGCGPTAPAAGDELSQARFWLETCKRPLIVVGLDVLSQNAVAPLQQAVEHLQAPLITSYKAKGVLPEDHDLAFGGAGLSPLSDKHLLRVVEAADLILAVGYDPIEMRPGWRNPWDPDRQRVIELNAQSIPHYMHQAGLSFTCDVGEGLKILLDGLTTESAWVEDFLSNARSALKDDFASKGQWGPSAIVEKAREVLPKDAIVTVDSGAHRILLSQLWDCYEPRTLLQSSGFCTMGCALPLAAGAKLADPSRVVAAVMGDGGLFMVLGELTTVAELDLPIVVIVFVDQSLALIEMKQRQRQLPKVGVDLARFDLKALGKALGGEGYVVDNAADLGGALKSAIAADRFSLIGCVIEEGAYDGRI